MLGRRAAAAVSIANLCALAHDERSTSGTVATSSGYPRCRMTRGLISLSLGLLGLRRAKEPFSHLSGVPPAYWHFSEFGVRYQASDGVAAQLGDRRDSDEIATMGIHEAGFLPVLGQPGQRHPHRVDTRVSVQLDCVPTRLDEDDVSTPDVPRAPL
jgi:hypothetical protein